MKIRMRCIQCLFALLLGLGALPCAARDVGLGDVHAVANSDGRLEIYGIGPDGTLYQRYELSPDADWSLWGVHRAPGNVGTDVIRAPAPDGRLYVASLDRGVLSLRRQQSANAGFEAQDVRTGHDLRSVALAINQDGTVAAFAIGGSEMLYYLSQQQPESGDWSDWSLVGGDSLRANPLPASGSLEAFIVRSQVLSAARNRNGALSAFAIGSTGSVVVATQAQPNSRSWSWTSLGGHDIDAISARTNRFGEITLVALGGDHALYARQQAKSGEWSEWMQLHPGPVADFALLSTPRDLVEVVAALPDSLVSRWQTSRILPTRPPLETGEVSWPGSATATIRVPEGATTPIRQVATARADDGRAGLFARDDRGEVFLLSRGATNDVNSWNDGAWMWLGGPTLVGERPDVLAQSLVCATDGVRASITKVLAAALNVQSGTSGLLRDVRNVSAFSACAPVQNAPRETLGVWFGRQPSAEFLTEGTSILETPTEQFLLGLRFTDEGIGRIIDRVWAMQPKRIDSSGNPVRDGEIQLDAISRSFTEPDLVSLKIDGRLWKGATGAEIPFPFTIYSDAKFGVSSGAVTCTEVTRVESSAAGLAAAINLLVPFNFGLAPAQDLVGAQDKAERRAQQLLGGKLCVLAGVIPSEVMIPEKSAAGHAQKLVFSFDNRWVDQHGVTLLANSPLLPVDRSPAIVWSYVYGSAERLDANHVRVRFRAIPQDLRLPQATWTFSRAGTTVQADDSVFPGESITAVFSVPVTATLNGLGLGTLTVAGIDADGQAVTYVHEVVLDHYALAKIPPNTFPPSKRLRPIQP